jgi:hypothetical protein
MINRCVKHCPRNCATGECSSPTFCNKCQTGGQTYLDIVKGKVEKKCIENGKSNEKRLSLAGRKDYNGYIVKGFVFGDIPQLLVGDHCAKCGELFTIALTNGSIADANKIQISYRRVPGSRNWFLILFKYEKSVTRISYTLKVADRYRTSLEAMPPVPDVITLPAWRNNINENLDLAQLVTDHNILVPIFA